jgi:hypothetical protein
VLVVATSCNFVCKHPVDVVLCSGLGLGLAPYLCKKEKKYVLCCLYSLLECLMLFTYRSTVIMLEI